MASDRLNVGIWSELPPGTPWGSDGVSRLVEFLIEGAAVEGRVRFIVAVPKGASAGIRASLTGLRAKEGLDWVLSEPPTEFSVKLSSAYKQLATKLGISESSIEMADYANRHLTVNGWIVSFPQFSGALLLNTPVATVVPDTLPFDFPIGWGDPSWEQNGFWTSWRRSSGILARSSSSVIVFSHHVARRHAVSILGCTEDQIHVIPHAPQDLAPLLPFVASRKRSAASVQCAAEIIRQHSRERGWSYLASFPFESTAYLVVSTHDRPTKNMFRVAEAIRRLIREKFRNIKMITTAPLLNAAWTRLPALISEAGMELDILSMPSLPRDVHAALYHAAALAVHPAMFEGGRTPFPFYEALSVGTPCLIADGPHVAELIEYDPEVRPFVFDPYNVSELTTKIEDVLTDPDPVIIAQQAIFERHLRLRTWTDVAHAYAAAAVGSEAASASGIFA